MHDAELFPVVLFVLLKTSAIILGRGREGKGEERKE